MNSKSTFDIVTKRLLLHERHRVGRQIVAHANIIFLKDFEIEFFLLGFVCKLHLSMIYLSEDRTAMTTPLEDKEWKKFRFYELGNKFPATKTLYNNNMEINSRTVSGSSGVLLGTVGRL